MCIVQLKDEMLKDVVGGADEVGGGSSGGSGNGGGGGGGIPLSPYETVVVDNSKILVALNKTPADIQLDLSGTARVANDHVLVITRR